jgi:hypothetical protein
MCRDDEHVCAVEGSVPEHWKRAPYKRKDG